MTGNENRKQQAARWKAGRRNFRVWQQQQALTRQALAAGPVKKRERFQHLSRVGWGLAAMVTTVKSFFSRRAS